uniref:uncharacterized protein LOC122601279 n=1 Tax=Erigeron canadensis TaxID=72917 RepID=UPI001CB99BB3|nr:uncharacterized protein LOC122601279 [Erigeron canadensis]
MHKAFVRDNPWVLLGDSNSALNLEDSSFGSSNISIGMRQFKQRVEDIEMIDINCSRFHYTWTQKPKNGTGILKKIDRVMGNIQFVRAFLAAHAVFQPYRISDYSLCILEIPNVSRDRPKPFKFPNFLVHKDEFKDMVQAHWNKSIDGCKMYRVVRKLRSLKHPIRSLLFKQGNLHNRVSKLREELDKIQKAINMEPGDETLRNQEVDILNKFKETTLDEERFLKKKAKIEWLEEYEGSDVPNALVTHYSNFLGVAGPGMEFESEDDEIKEAMFSVDDNKAPGCAFKVDIQKAYDKVDWEFLRVILGKRGLRQGDPMSPYLFALVMEVLTLILQKLVRESPHFSFYNQCKEEQIINLCFVNDLFLFARGDLASAKFEEGSLPIRYLGVPLISSRLVYKDCKVLLERMQAMITHWKNKSLSFAGRLQLINSFLCSMHIYWASIFILPISILHELEKMMRGFLWCQGPMAKGKAKVAWKDCCLPKYERGLGCSWGWRKILLLRDFIRPHIKYRIGNGDTTSAWFDFRLDIGPLCNYISNREIIRAGFKKECLSVELGKASCYDAARFMQMG